MNYCGITPVKDRCKCTFVVDNEREISYIIPCQTPWKHKECTCGDNNESSKQSSEVLFAPGLFNIG